MDYRLTGLMPGDGGIVQTVNKMVGAVRWSLTNYPIRKRAERVIANCHERDETCEVSSIFNWVLAHFRYTKDPRFLEMYKSPEIVDQEIDAHNIFQGDCDDVSGYLAALLMSIGYPVKFVIISIPNQGDEYKHIYPMVYLSKRKRWLSMEATARNYSLGFEAPGGSRRREFSI